ncbi:hypothetical protein [Candidatus Hakubella thermalkaliphila]|uniref:Uncharacterized protein n=1 Tax=Candidatus Hakubella thermalkaliphila TaxID=2754717 RepID=A0A6V8PHC3_9ACTN|nr:hypothetical protein [Candidatus Hakubella thermalkaliphila]GFP31500.1 hypothetical protein HKBW3S34_02420 [Candidatus Hakubella thermalkaliphila]
MKALEIDDRLESLISELEFKEAKEVIKDSLFTEILYRISKFTDEVNWFNDKYGKTLEEFKKEYESKAEDYEKYDDLMAWEFAQQGKEYWEKKLEELKSVL